MDVAAHSLHAIPDVVHRDPHPPGMATLTFWMWVAPVGEPLKPVRASIHLSAAGAPLESITLEATQLAALGGAPPRSFDREGGLWLSHQLTTVIDHGKAEYSLLGHLRQGSLTVASGERIDAGQHIGRVGNSGHSSGPHLHYHLMDGPELFRSNGLPARFLGLEAEIPRRGALLEAP